MSTKSNRETTFRFPFDIDTRYFLVLAALFFILSIRPIRQMMSSKLTVPKLKEKVEKDANAKLNQFTNILKDSVLIDAFFSQTLNDSEFKVFDKLAYSVFFYKHHELVGWNTTKTKNPADTFTANRPCAYRDNSGYFIVFQKNIDAERSVVALIKVKNDIGIQNAFFTKNFPVDDDENDFNIDLDSVSHPASMPLSIQGHTLYHIVQRSGKINLNDPNGWRLFFCAIPFILFGVSIHTYFKVKVKKKNAQEIFALLLLTIVVVRGTTYLWGFPNSFDEFYLFQPECFIADNINRSLGDLFINMCLIFWVLLFLIINVQGKVYDLKHYRYRAVIGVVIYFISMAGAIYLVRLVLKLINDSSINFDTSQFSELNLASFIGILSVMTIFVNFFYLSIISKNYAEVCFDNRYVKYILTAIIYLFFIFFTSGFENQAVSFYAFMCTALFFLMQDLNYLKTKFDFSSYKLLIWMIIISTTGSIFLTVLINHKKIIEMQREAERLGAFNPKQIEKKLVTIAHSLEEDSRFKELADSLKVNDVFLTSYILQQFKRNGIDDYQIDFHELREQNGDSFSNGNDSNDSMIRYFHLTQYEGYKVYITLPTHKGAYTNVEIVVSKRKEVIPNDYTDLMVQNKASNFLRNKMYSSAIYRDDVLTQQTGSYLFPLHLKENESDVNQNVIVDKQNYVDVWYRNPNLNCKVIILKQRNNFSLFTSMLAYIFLLYFLVISLYILGNIIARSNLNYKRFINLMSINLRLRIHFSILLVVLCSFIIIGYFTTYYLIGKVNDEMKKNLSKYNFYIEEEVKQNRLHKEQMADTPDKINQLNVVAIKEISERFSININLFSVGKGKLLYSSSPELFDKEIMLDHIDPGIFYKVKRNMFNSIIQEERVGMLQYLSSYFLIRNSNDENIGIVQIPFFRSNTEIGSETTAIITTLINIYIFVFLISAIIAFFLTKSVTRPFTYIVKQFTKINLSKTNEPLKWFDSDEIGLLIKEYNRMLRKLENSTILLAKSERESAWREMAKQVAHEIKNPLTPMKLSLQMLERAIKNNHANVNEMTIKMTKTLIEQIDNLSLIATNFSNFAKLPVSHKEVFLLNELLFSVTGMYHDDNQNEFLFIIPEYEIELYADKSQIMRVFTNIIQNAIQSIPETKKGNIALTVSKIKNHFIRISILDNGEGISEEQGLYLFQPYFTTKTSGTGLGLAMCNDIIVESGGKISFESKVGIGTTFYIDLKIHEPE